MHIITAVRSIARNILTLSCGCQNFEIACRIKLQKISYSELILDKDVFWLVKLSFRTEDQMSIEGPGN